MLYLWYDLNHLFLTFFNLKCPLKCPATNLERNCCLPNGCRQKGEALSFPLWDAGGSKHVPLRVLGPIFNRRLPLFLHQQGPGGSTVGAEKGQQETHDLPEDVPRPEKLRSVWRDLQGEEEAHLPVQRGHADDAAEETARRLITCSWCSDRSSGLQHYSLIIGFASQC